MGRFPRRANALAGQTSKASPLNGAAARARPAKVARTAAMAKVGWNSVISILLVFDLSIRAMGPSRRLKPCYSPCGDEREHQGCKHPIQKCITPAELSGVGHVRLE